MLRSYALFLFNFNALPVVQFQTQAYVAVQRTEALLLLEEISDSVSGNSSALETKEVLAFNDQNDNVMITLKNFDASWEVEDETSQSTEQATANDGASGGDIELGGKAPSDELP